MSRKDQDGFRRIGVEDAKVRLMPEQERQQIGAGAVAQPQPDQLGWMAVKQAALAEVGILRRGRIPKWSRRSPL